MVTKFRIYLQKALITGILATLPLVVTFWCIKFIFDKFSGFFLPYLVLITKAVDVELPLYAQKIISFVIVMLIMIAIGIAAKNYLGRKMLSVVQKTAEKIPVVRSIYSSIRQVVDAIQTAGGGSFKQVVLVEYPRPGMYSMAFITKDSSEFLNQATGEECINIFIPTTPNPTSGFALIVPKKSIIDPGITVDSGIKFIISAGLVEPDYNEQKKVE